MVIWAMETPPRGPRGLDTQPLHRGCRALARKRAIEIGPRLSQRPCSLFVNVSRARRRSVSGNIAAVVSFFQMCWWDLTCHALATTIASAKAATTAFALEHAYPRATSR